MRTSVVLLLALTGCGPTVSPADDDDPDAGGVEVDAATAACTGSQTRCYGDMFQTCDGDHFVDTERCIDPEVCLPHDGCVAADAVDCDTEGAGLIYVVDDTKHLKRFDPRDDANTFTDIGTLECGTGFGTPFSMSVDRDGTAWVLYNDGNLYHVSTTDASCTTTAWTAGNGGDSTFGMGFVSDAAGSEAEHLFVTGQLSHNLKSIDKTTLAVTTIGPYAQHDNPPELTGTGNGEVYAYYPGTTTALVVKLDRDTAAADDSWDVPTIQGSPQAWAFAHWGGRFYIFVTEQGTGTPNSKVYRLDPATGETPLLLEHLPSYIVGAGVSTCAPVVVD